MRILCTSPWIPPEWIRAHGFVPHGIWACEARGPEQASSAGMCAFAGFAADMARQEPDLPILFSSHCDQLRRTFDTIGRAGRPRAFLFNLPATWKTETAVRLFDAELERLGRFLLQLGGQAPSSATLAELCASYRAARCQLGQFAGRISQRDFLEATLQLMETGSVKPGTGPGGPGRELGLARSDGKNGAAVPIALIGGPMRRTDWPILDLVEQLGGRIVLNATEPGERNVCHSPEAERQEFSALAAVEQLRLNLAQTCVARCADVYQRPNKPLYDWLAHRLAQRRVRGIVLWHYDWCDLWRAETQTLREKFGLPVLPLESNALTGGSPRMLTRLQAFLESLQ